MGASACLLPVPTDAEARTLGLLPPKETWKLTPSLILFGPSVQQSLCPSGWQGRLLSVGRRGGLPAPLPPVSGD